MGRSSMKSEPLVLSTEMKGQPQPPLSSPTRLQLQPTNVAIVEAPQLHKRVLCAAHWPDVLGGGAIGEQHLRQAGGHVRVGGATVEQRSEDDAEAGAGNNGSQQHRRAGGEAEACLVEAVLLHQLFIGANPITYKVKSHFNVEKAVQHKKTPKWSQSERPLPEMLQYCQLCTNHRLQLSALNQVAERRFSGGQIGRQWNDSSGSRARRKHQPGNDVSAEEELSKNDVSTFFGSSGVTILSGGMPSTSASRSSFELGNRLLKSPNSIEVTAQ
ncbi:hypothetical protein TYRP_015394 [Tyrophagus putrescentiae]|nr:hypothetical protein TYRP_015394 [Tyrophagus putrescentiae]